MDAPMAVKITDEHRWFDQLIGEWRFEIDCPGPDGAPSARHTGRESVRRLGDAWVLLESHGRMPGSEGGGDMLSQMMLGYDPDKGHYVGTFITSMMTWLWQYHGGRLDATRLQLTLEAEGPSFDGGAGKLANYRDVIEIVSPDERLLHCNVQGADGTWTRFMTSRYLRVR